MRKHQSRWLQSCRLTLSALAIGQFVVTPVLAAPKKGDDSKTPIKHVIVIIGENRSFDHVFATYVPKKAGESVDNLLSKGIIKLDSNKNAIPGPNFALAHQAAASDAGPADAFLLSPPQQNFPADQLPPPIVGGTATSYLSPATEAAAKATESGLAEGYYQFLTSGGYNSDRKSVV